MAKTAAHLGQHFLHSKSAALAMIDAAHIDETTTVLEIGPGEGALTTELLAHAKKVIAIEKDSALAERLRETFAHDIQNGTLILIEGDTRDHPTDALDINGEYVVAANIPYYITGEIIRTLLTSDKQPKHIALLIQKEVAQRILARDGKESILSLSVKAYGTPRIVKTVPRGSFRPPPSVDSAIIAIEHISRDFFNDITEARFFEVVRAGFARKRKMLAGNLKAIATPEKIAHAFDTCGVSPTARAEDLPLAVWGKLVRALY